MDKWDLTPVACVQAANAVYCIALAHLIRSPGNAEAALIAAQTFAQNHAPSEVRQWLAEALGPTPLPSIAQGGCAEWVRWPFTCAFRSAYHLSVRRPRPIFLSSNAMHEHWGCNVSEPSRQVGQGSEDAI